MHTQTTKLSLIVLGISFLITGCGGANKDNKPQKNDSAKTSETSCGNTQVSASKDGIKQIKINAASYDCWAYIELESGKSLALNDEQAKNSNQWHLAFKRNKIKANGGDSGAGKVSVALADDQAEFYNNSQKPRPVVKTFINATADAYQDDLKRAYDASKLSFKVDQNTPAIQSWYTYNPSTHQISANSNYFWIMQNSDDSTYVKFKLTQASYNSLGFEYYLQTSSDAAFKNTKQTLTAQVEANKKEVCIDFDTNQTLDCSASGWDIRYEANPMARKINLWLNSNVHGGGKGKALTLESSHWAQSDYSKVDGVIKNHLQEDKGSGVLEDKTWWAYNLKSEHKLWPNFRTYVIKVGDSNPAYYNLQVVNYYSLGDSGSPEIHLYQPREN